MTLEVGIAIAMGVIALGGALISFKSLSHTIKRDIKQLPGEDYKQAIAEAHRAGAMEITLKQIEKNTESLMTSMSETQRDIRAMDSRIGKAETAIAALNTRMDAHLREPGGAAK